jgi:hypothetical protein
VTTAQVQICYTPGTLPTEVRMRVWLVLLALLAATIESGCADVHARASLPASFAPDTARSYLYGRFSLKPGSES